MLSGFTPAPLFETELGLEAMSVPTGTLIFVETEHGADLGAGIANREQGSAARVPLRIAELDPVVAAVAAARADDPSCGIRVVGSDRRTDGAWNRLIEAHGALFDVAVLTPLRLARECVPGLPRSPDHLQVRAAMRELLRSHGVGVGLLDSALGVWTQLDSSSTDSLAAAQQSNDSGVEPVGWTGPDYGSLVPAMVTALDGAGDTPGAVIRRATAQLLSIGGGCLPFDVVIAVDVASWTPAAIELLHALHLRGDVRVVCIGWGHVATAGTSEADTSRWPSQPSVGRELSAAVVPTAADEAVWVTGVVGAWCTAGVPLDDIAVVVPAEPGAGTAMRSALESSGLLVRSSPPPTDPAELACVLRMQLLVDDAEAVDVAGLAALVPEHGTAWVRFARKWGVLRGIGAWRAAASSRHMPASAGRRAPGGARHPGDEEHFAAWLLGTLDEVASAEPPTTWSDWARLLADWARVPAAGESGLEEPELREASEDSTTGEAPAGTAGTPGDAGAMAAHSARSRLQATIAQLATLDRWESTSGQVDAGLVLSELRAGLATARSRDGWKGVVVATAVDLPLRHWAALVVTGLSERMLPQPARRDPLVGVAAAQLFSLPLADSVPRHEAAVLVDAASRAERVALCRASHDSGGRSRDPSPLWEVLLAGAAVSPGSVATFDSPLAVLADRAERGGDRREDRVLADAAYRVAVGLGERADWRSRPDAALEAMVANPVLVSDRRAVDRLGVMARRRPAGWSKFEGVVGSSWVPPEKISPTSLERFASCPRRYYFRASLGIDPLSDPDDELDLAPRNRGIVVHEVLCQLVGEALERSGHAATVAEFVSGAVVTTPYAFVTAGVEIVDSGVIDRWISDALERQAGGRVRLGQWAEHSVVSRAVGSVWSELLADVANGWMPIATEFGRRFSISQLVPGRSLQMTAQIDRLDRHVDGRLRVVDYKTSSTVNQKELARQSVRALLLQPTLYSAAITEFTGAPMAPAELWFVGSKWARVVVPACPPNVLTALLDALDAGVFPFHPGAASTRSGFDFENCGYCEFRAACPPDRGRRWESAQDADEITAYRMFLAVAEQAATDLEFAQ